jgi:serine/threonine protein kinase
MKALYFAYEYIPGAETLEEHFLRDPTKDKTPIPEDTLWSVIIQIISGLKKIHSMGLACRILVPSKILICGVRNRYFFFISLINQNTNYEQGNYFETTNEKNAEIFLFVMR